MCFLRPQSFIGYPCHTFTPNHMGSMNLFHQTLQRKFHRFILLHTKKDALFACLKNIIPHLSSSNSFPECKEAVKSVDRIYVAHAFESFISEFLFGILTRLLIN